MTAPYGPLSSSVGISLTTRTPARQCRPACLSLCSRFLQGGGTAYFTRLLPTQWMRQALTACSPHQANSLTPVDMPSASGTHHWSFALSSIASPWQDGTQCRTPTPQEGTRAWGQWSKSSNHPHLHLTSCGRDGSQTGASYTGNCSIPVSPSLGRGTKSSTSQARRPSLLSSPSIKREH